MRLGNSRKQCEPGFKYTIFDEKQIYLYNKNLYKLYACLQGFGFLASVEEICILAGNQGDVFSGNADSYCECKSLRVMYNSSDK